MPTTRLRPPRTLPYRRRRIPAYFGTQPAPVTFPSSPLTTRVYIALGADLTASHLTWNWLDVTGYVRHDLGIAITAGRRDERTQVTASRCLIKLSNTDGRFTRRNPSSPYYGLLTKNTPIWIQVNPGSGFRDRYFGFVNEWPVKWADPSGTDSYVTIQCAGIMRRLAQGEVLGSPLRRSISGVAPGDYVPFAYWPMEDGSKATQIASGLPAGQPMVTSGTVTFANASDLVGSKPLLTLATAATATASIASYSDTGQWVCQFVFKLPSEPASTTDIAEILVTGGFWSKHVVKCIPGTPSFLQVDHYVGSSVSSSSAVELDATTETYIYGKWVMCSVTQKAISGSLAEAFGDFIYLVNGVPTAAGVGVIETGTPGRPTQVQLKGGNGIAFGHLSVFTDPRFNYLTDVDQNASAMTGYDGELAHVRMTRLCREERLPFVTQAPTSAAMGPQEVDSLLDLLRNCEAADQGVLYEHQFGLAYQSLAERYNQPVTFNLDFTAGHIAGTPEPADDDQRLVNRFTANRTNGSSATIEQTTGTLGTAPGGSGVYDDSASVNVYADSQLADYASWRVHVGTVDEDRWPLLAFHLHRNPSLISNWTSALFGARINAAHPPAQMAPDTIDAIIEGYGERWDGVSWDVGLITSPASGLNVLVLDDTDYGRIDSGSSSLTADITSGATSVMVTTTDSGELWTTDAAEMPVDVTFGGERATVSSIISAVNDTFTRTESNGWGTADTGQAWSVLDGSASSFATSGGRGVITLPTGDTNPRMITLSPSFSDLDLLVPFSVSQVATGAAIVAELVFRVQDNANFYRATFGFTTGSTVDVSLVRVVNGAGTSLASVTGAFAYVNNVDVYLYVQAHGSTLKVAASTSDFLTLPTFWTLEPGPDSTFSSGQVGVRARLVGGNTNVNPQVSTDNFKVLNPQTFTATRAVNGVTKAHTAGTEVHIRNPFVLAL